MEKNKNKNRIHILVVDVSFSYGADFHTEKVNGKLNEIQRNGIAFIVFSIANKSFPISDNHLHEWNLSGIDLQRLTGFDWSWVGRCCSVVFCF